MSWWLALSGRDTSAKVRYWVKRTDGL